jgi:hypothetical protein
VPDISSLVRALRSDPLGAQEHQAYLDAVGAPLVPTQAMAPQMSNQGVQPIPPNVAGLAKLLIQTGRATPETALGMAQQMTVGR